ncbi:MAG: sialidase family protein [Blastocatellia bacterium]|nr:sialidase family protein [Blastocatellia bacterium]
MKITRRDFIVAGGALAAFSPGPHLEKQALFEADQGGYKLYRIPGLIVTRRGTALAYCEARKFSGSDWGTIDILLRRSGDHGRTWDAPRRIAEVEGPKSRNPVALEKKQGAPDDVTYNNPVAIADRQTGAVHFLFCLEYARCFYMRSEDEGRTFTKPVEITSTFEAFRSRYNWRVIATGPAHGIQLKNGRLVVPVWLSLGETGNGHGPSVTSVIYSDDHGRTWRAGDIIGLDAPDLVSPNETVVAQLNDGRTLLNMRSLSKANRRAVTTSRDGATGWSAPVFHDELIDPICMASLVRFSARPSRLLFANPHNLTRADGKETPGGGRDRKNLSIRLSHDEGRTWPVIRTLEPGPSGYSDLAVAKDGTILCFYEGNSPARSASYTGQLTLARFTLDWLTNGRP